MKADTQEYGITICPFCCFLVGGHDEGMDGAHILSGVLALSFDSDSDSSVGLRALFEVHTLWT